MGVVLSNDESLLAGLCNLFALLKLHNVHDDVFLKEKEMYSMKCHPLVFTQRGGALVPNHTYYIRCK